MYSEQQRRDLIVRLFTPATASALLAADMPARERMLKQLVQACHDDLPAPAGGWDTRELAAGELRVADELRDFKVPLMDGTAVDMGLPYNWTFGVADGNLGGKAPLFIVPRIAFSGILVRACEQTGDRGYAQALRDYIVDYVSRFWTDSTELPPKENWLCTACRCGAWHCERFPGIYGALKSDMVLECLSFDDLLATFRAIDNMMTGLIPNLALGSNWRVHQITNIFTQGMSWTFLVNAAMWLELAVNAMNEEFDVQFHDDGSHEELCSHYGAGTWQVFAAYQALAEHRPDLGIAFDRGKMQRCIEYYLSSCKPFGPLAAIGDDYASRDLAALDRDSQPYPASATPRWDTTVRRGAAWLADRGFPAADFIVHGARTLIPEWTTRRHADSGYMFMRDGWGPHSLYADLNMGYYSNCHCHYGLLGLQVAGYGREFIVDPGCSALDPRDINANMARTRAHSTVCVDGLDQQVNAPVRLSRCFIGRHYDFAVGVYKGGWRSGNAYGPGTVAAAPFDHAFGGTHFRHVLFAKHSYWVVFDAVTTKPGHLAETRFQFMPNPMRALPEGGGYVTGWGHSNLALVPLHWEGWEHGLCEGETDPIEGWMPVPGGEFTAAPVYKATRATDSQPLWHGSLLFPFRGADMPRLDITPLPAGDRGFGYRIATDQYTDYLFISNSWCAADVRLDGIQTNAPLVHVRCAGGTFVRGCTCEGTYLKLDGQSVFEAPGTMLAREFDDFAASSPRVMQPRK